MNSIPAEREPDRHCFVCRGPLALFGPCGGHRYYLCSDCGSIQLWPMPAPEELESLYATQYVHDNLNEATISPESWRTISGNYRSAVIALLEKHGMRERLVDFGAGYGFLVEDLKRRGIPCCGLELSDQKLAYCRAHGVDVRKGGLEELLRMGGQVKGVIMIAVFEHLTDHPGFLKRLNKALPPAGVFVTLHPTAGFYRMAGDVARLFRRGRELPGIDNSFAPPWHTAFLSLKGMRLLAGEAGFATVDVQPAPQGRRGGLLGLMQIALESINKPGFRIFANRWPLITSHIFYLRKEAPGHG